MFRNEVISKFGLAFGDVSRNTSKVVAWNINTDLSVVVQKDSPKNGEHAIVWLPYPPDGESIPEMALEYAAESGRHSNTYPAPGLEKGLPALKLKVEDTSELEEVIDYVRAMRALRPLPKVHRGHIKEASESRYSDPHRVDIASMPKPKPKKPRREAIPRDVQREVWQRDGGECVDCGTRERLCFDHIVPFSKGGSNTVRNLQLLCESCNLSKGNRI